MDVALFAQLTTLGSSIVLLFGITLLWRRSLHAYIDAFRWQSVVLAVLFVLIGYFGDDPELYFVAVFFFVLKVIILPSLPAIACSSESARRAKFSLMSTWQPR